MTRERELVRGAVIYLYDNDHPFLVVSSNFINKYSRDVIVVSMSSRHKRMDLKTHTVVNFHESAVLCENVKIVNKENIRVIAHILNRASMKKVDECLKHTFGLN